MTLVLAENMISSAVDTMYMRGITREYVLRDRKHILTRQVSLYSYALTQAGTNGCFAYSLNEFWQRDTRRLEVPEIPHSQKPHLMTVPKKTLRDVAFCLYCLGFLRHAICGTSIILVSKSLVIAGD